MQKYDFADCAFLKFEERLPNNKIGIFFKGVLSYLKLVLPTLFQKYQNCELIIEIVARPFKI